MPPLPLRTWPAWSERACSNALRTSGERSAAASIRSAGDTPAGERSGGDSRACARRPRRQLVLAALDSQLDRPGIASQVHPARAGIGGESVEELVGVEWVMVEEDGPLHPGAAREAERMRGRRVAPTDV